MLEQKSLSYKSCGRSLAHLDLINSVHKEDSLFSDPLEERKNVRQLDGSFQFRGGVVDEAHFDRLASIAANEGARDLIGYYFVWSPPDIPQALLHGLSDGELSKELRVWLDEFDKMLSQRFGDPARAIAIHTDKVRLHFEVICLKYDENGHKNFLFDYCNPGKTHVVADAVRAALFGAQKPNSIWTAESIYDLTSWGMTRLRDHYKALETAVWTDPENSTLTAQEYNQSWAIAAEYRQFLQVSMTDGSFENQPKAFKQLPFPVAKGTKAVAPVRQEFEASLGSQLAIPNEFTLQEPPDFICLARARAERILKRRILESERKRNLNSRNKERATHRKYHQERKKWFDSMPPDERNRHIIREGDLLEARLQSDIKNGKVMPSVFDLAKDYDNLNTILAHAPISGRIEADIEKPREAPSPEIENDEDVLDI